MGKNKTFCKPLTRKTNKHPRRKNKQTLCHTHYTKHKTPNVESMNSHHDGPQSLTRQVPQILGAQHSEKRVHRCSDCLQLYCLCKMIYGCTYNRASVYAADTHTSKCGSINIQSTGFQLQIAPRCGNVWKCWQNAWNVDEAHKTASDEKIDENSLNSNVCKTMTCVYIYRSHRELTKPPEKYREKNAKLQQIP